MKNGTVKISCALAALALVITAGLSGCGANSGDAKFGYTAIFGKRSK